MVLNIGYYALFIFETVIVKLYQLVIEDKHIKQTGAYQTMATINQYFRKALNCALKTD